MKIRRGKARRLKQSWEGNERNQVGERERKV
jgi:hypothetical protein